MDVTKASEIVAIMLSPTLVIGTLLYLPRGVRAVHRLVRSRTGAVSPQPAHPPIEQLAADLRRLLGRHDALRRSPEVAMRAQHMRALEGAITDCAVEAARALGLPCPDQPARGGLAAPELRRLLRALADAGLMLPPSVGLLSDKRL